MKKKSWIHGTYMLDTIHFSKSFGLVREFRDKLKKKPNSKIAVFSEKAKSFVRSQGVPDKNIWLVKS